MANPLLTPAQVGVLMNEGTFRGLRKLLDSGQITEAQASHVLGRSYETMLKQVKEARSEMQHVQIALARLENFLTLGQQSRKPVRSDTVAAQSSQIGVALMAFDGWVVSLMETNLTITGMLNPAVTRAKIKEFGTAMNALMDKRMAKNHPAYKDRDAFEGYVNGWRKKPAATTAQGSTK